MRWQRIYYLLVKEFSQLRRDRRLVSVLIVAPVIQLLVLSYAANTDVKQVNIAVRDNDRSYFSRELVRSLSATEYFNVFWAGGSESQDGEQLVTGVAGTVLVIPPDFGKNIMLGKPASVQALVDGSDSNFGVQGLNYLQKAFKQYSERVGLSLHRNRQAAVAVIPSVQVESRVWFNPDLKSRYFMVPAIMAQLLMVATMLVTSMALVKEREEGTFEQLIVTPIRPLEIVVGKLLPFVFIGFIEMTIALPVMLFVLGVPFRGNFGALYLMSGIFLLSTLGLGLFISTLVKTQQQAMMVATFFVMLPFILLSGFAFPVENMPTAIRAVAELIPMRYYLIAVRSLFLKGAQLEDLIREAVIMFVWGIGILSLALLKFRKRID